MSKYRRYNLRRHDDTSINRADAEVFIREQYGTEIMQGALARSVVLSLGDRLPDMTSNQTVLPVLTASPEVYFVDGDNGFKSPTKMAWAKKKIHSEEIACIIPIPENVLDDSSYDLKSLIVPQAQDKMGEAIDAAVLFGRGKPAEWPDSLVDQITAAGAVVEAGLSTYDDLLGVGGVISKVERSGYRVNGHAADIGFKATLRSIKDNNGRPIFVDTMQGSTNYGLDGSPIFFAESDAFDASKAYIISGDFRQLKYAIRQDIKVKLLDQASIYDPATKELLYALAQQDMVAMRFTMRLGWQCPNPINALNKTATRFPFALLKPKAAETGASAYGLRNDDYNGYTSDQLNKMTIDQIKDLAADNGYEITATIKADIISEFLAAQDAAKARG